MKSKSVVILRPEFIQQYPDFPAHMHELGMFVYYRTYSRFIPHKGRRETWKETCTRSITYNVGLAINHMEKIGRPYPLEDMQAEAEKFFDAMFNLEQFLSGRTLWVGGASNESGKSVAELYPLSNFNCFTRETEFITDKGLKSFLDFNDGDTVNVLSSTGGWKPATVRSFGESKVVELTVFRGRRKDTIRTTENHRWFVRKSKGEKKYIEKTTVELKPGDILRSKKRYEKTSIVPCPIGIMHGIVFGDGTYDKKMNHCRVALVGEKQELVDLFTAGSRSTAGKSDQIVVYGLPNTWKDLPTRNTNVEYLMGFLMGLFATDGSNSNNQHTISSANKGNLEFIRSIAPMLGFSTGMVRQIRDDSPYTGEHAPLYQISLHACDIDDEFLLRTAHKNNYTSTDKDISWSVDNIQKTAVVEDVWCVQEPETESFTLANGILTRNCSFLTINNWKALAEMFYLLLVGTGVGYKCTKQMAKNLKPIRNNVKIIHSNYNPLPKAERIEHTQLHKMGNGYAKIWVGDSKEGWVESLATFLELLTEKEHEVIHTIKISYNSIREQGERLNTFGGYASGYEPLRDMFDGFMKVLGNQIDPTLAPLEVTDGHNGYVKVRPIHILDMGNLIGHNVVVGGVRRTAEIFLFDSDDYESMFAKYGINGIWGENGFDRHEKVRQALISAGVPIPAWFEDLALRHYHEGSTSPHNLGRPLHHRRMSNNSIAFTKKPKKDFLKLVFELLQMEGEPGFVNLEELARRRLAGQGIHNPSRKLLELVMILIGMNPCAEINLYDRGVCNLTTVNIVAFVEQVGKKFTLNVEKLLNAQRLSARAGMRMTLANLEHMPWAENPEAWDNTQKIDRLIGTSVTGHKDAMSLLGYSDNDEAMLLTAMSDVVADEVEKYSRFLRIVAPLLDTTVKPEGTQSQVASSKVLRSPVSSGLHESHSPYFIRRVRISAVDPLAKAVRMHNGWVVNPEVDTPGDTHEERMANAKTYVIDFPIASGSTKTKDDVSALEQLNTYFRFQEAYTRHNSSNTITVKPGEWESLMERIYSDWDRFAAVSFLSHDGGTYRLAPYEAITEEQYHELKAKMEPFNVDLLAYVEGGTEQEIGLDTAGCESGVCPIR